MLLEIKRLISLVAILSIVFNSLNALGQKPYQATTGEIQHKIKKLNVLGSVLYFAAHPDDENTQFIGYMANERLYHTSYLSLTRGDGGQNLIGPEMRDLLGLIRTQELLQARKVDGGKQYFSRANDFGFSKSPNEAFDIWSRENVLADAVWVIRNVQPDIIVTRFPPDERAGHGHHTASAMLAAEAFDAAADPTRFPEQLRYVKPWKTTRLVWNIGMWAVRDRAAFVKNAANYLKLDVGSYNPLLGKSYGEMAAQSRSMHKSQGFGSVGSRGENIDYFEHTKGPKATSDLMEGVETSWSRVPGASNIQNLILELQRNYQPADPSLSVPMVLQLRRELKKLPDGFWKKIKLEETESLLKDMMGLYLEASVKQQRIAQGNELHYTIEAINRSNIQSSLHAIRLPFQATDSLLAINLKQNQVELITGTVKVPTNQPVSQPYWLQKQIGYGGLFEVEDQLLRGTPENAPAAEVAFKLIIEQDTLTFNNAVVYKQRDPVKGEVYQPLVITNPISITLGQDVYFFPTSAPQTVKVRLRSAQKQAEGYVRLKLPSKWKVSPEKIDFKLNGINQEAEYSFQVIPTTQSEVIEIGAEAVMDKKVYQQGLAVISYDHIPEQTYFPIASARGVRMQLQKKGVQVGYIMGAGDMIPEVLKQLGYTVDLLDDKMVQSANLNKYNAIVVGVRAYNTNPKMVQHHPILLEYVKNGGNLIVQYNTSGDVVVPQLGPYPFELSRDRITDEYAPVRIISPNHKALTTPNKITNSDFEGWVQERGLYFPKNWAPNYQTLISSNDAGEPALDGGILIAAYGKGNYVYTSLSWFRELPAGVPGACRIFVNLISLGQ